MTSLVYSTGTVSVSNASAVVTGTSTAWALALVTGGMFSFAGMSVPILSVENDTSLTLAYAWPGATASGAYAIARETSEAVRAAWINDRLAQILTKLSLVGIHPDGAGTLAERNALSPAPPVGYLWLRVELGFDLAFYKRTASGWDGPFALKGDEGNQGPAGATGPAGEGFNPVGAWVIGTTYSGGDFVSHSGRTFVSLADGNAGNIPPVTDTDDAFWMFIPTAAGPTGPKGDTGNTGPKGDTGDTGATGPANNLAIGSVTGGSTADATITGTTPSQTLNLVLPKGDKGDQGDVGPKGDPGAGSVDSVNGDPGPDIVLDLDDIGDGAVNKAFTSTEKTKLAGVAPGATANSSDAALVARANHTGTQSADTITDGTTNKAYSATDKTKLDGIATGADKTTPANVGSSIAGTSQVASPADGERFAGVLAGGSTLFWTTFGNIKAGLKAYFDTVYVALSRTVTAGTGLTGGGDMTANRTLAIDKASAANLRAGTADKVLTPDIALSAMDWVAIIAGASPAIDHAAGVNRTITQTANATMGAPSNAKPGWPLNIDVTPASFTTSWNAAYKFGAAGAPPITSRRLVHFICRDASTFVFLGTSEPT